MGAALEKTKRPKGEKKNPTAVAWVDAEEFDPQPGTVG